MGPCGDYRRKGTFSATRNQEGLNSRANVLQPIQAQPNLQRVGRRGPSASVDRSVSRRPGFTLLELLIVLTIMATFAAMVWPRIQRRVGRSQLKQLAIDLQEEIADARALAIRNGSTFELRFTVGSDSYWLGPQNQLPTRTNEQAGSRPENRLTFEEIAIGGESNEPDDNLNATSQVLRKQLEASVFLADAESVSKLTAAGDEGEQPPVKPANVETINLETIEIGGGGIDATDSRQESVVLTPDGRADDLEFAFCDRRLGLGIRVRIRGLTGQVEIGDLFSFPRELPVSDPQSESAESQPLDSELETELPTSEELAE